MRGGKDLSGEVVFSSDLGASVYISGGYSSLPVVLPVIFQCIPVNCKQFRNFQSPQLKRSESRGLVLCVCGHYQGAFAIHAWNENDPQCQTNKHSLIHSASLVNCSRFCELACIINYRTKNVRVLVLSWEVTCTSLFLFVAVQLLDWEEHQNAYAEGDDVCRNVVGRNCNWNLLRLLYRERITSGMYFATYLWHSELALKVLKRITLLFGFSFFFLKTGHFT